MIVHNTNIALYLELMSSASLLIPDGFSCTRLKVVLNFLRYLSAIFSVNVVATDLFRPGCLGSSN